MKNVNNFNIEKTKVKRQIVFCWNDGYDYGSHFENVYKYEVEDD